MELDASDLIGENKSLESSEDTFENSDRERQRTKTQKPEPLEIKDKEPISSLKDTEEKYQAILQKEEANGSFFDSFKEILKESSSRNIVFMGLYLRMAKKYVDYGFHLWAEISVKENGLGLDRALLGKLSTSGGISSVLLYFTIFNNQKPEDLPYLTKRSLLLLSLTTMAFPFLVFLSGFWLELGIFVSILSFMINEAILFTAWVGLLNIYIKKHMIAKCYSLSLAIKGIIGSTCSYLIFESFKWSLDSKLISDWLAPLNSILFFWAFSFGSILMLKFYKFQAD